jgi:hypothetical protein
LGLGMRFSAEWIYLSAPRPGEANGQLKSLIVDELWMRKVMPPSLRRNCYTGETTVCNLTDAVVSAYYDWYYPDSAKSEKAREQEEYWGTAFMGLVSGLTSGTIVWFLTGKAQPVQAT